METQRNADDGISAESVNEKAKQGGQGEEKDVYKRQQMENVSI